MNSRSRQRTWLLALFLAGGTAARAAPPAPAHLPAQTPRELIRQATGEARSLLEQKKPAAAAERLQPLLDDLLHLKGEDWRLASGVIGTLAMALHAQGSDFAVSDRPRLLRLLELQEAALGPGHQDLAAVMEEIGCVDEAADDYESATLFYRRVLALGHGQALPPLDRVRLLSHLGRSLLWLGDSAGALEMNRQGLGLLQELYGKPGELLHRPEIGPGHEAVAAHLLDFAISHFHLGLKAEAQRLLEQSLALYRRLPGPRRQAIANVLLRLGWVVGERGELGAAQQHLEEARQLFAASLRPEHPSVGFLAILQGRFALQAGDEENARRLFEKGLPLLEKTFGASSPQAGLGHQLIATLAWRQGDLAEARIWLERGLADYPADPPHPARAAIHALLARLDLAARKPASAFEHARLAEAGGRETLKWNFEALAERPSLLLAASRPTGLPILLTVALEDPAKVADAFDELIRSRALVFDEMAARQHLAATVENPEMRQWLLELATARQRLADLYGRHNASPQAIALATRRRDQAQAALSRSQMLARHLEGRRNLGLPDILAALPPGDALLAYVHFRRFEVPKAARPGEPGENFYAAFLLPAGQSRPLLIPLGPAAEIDAAVAAWLDQGDNHSEARYRRRAETLRRLVWDPVASRLESAHHIFVVPAGSLHHLSLATLPTGDSAYLVEGESLFHHLSAERDLVPSRLPEKRGEGALAVGGVQFDLDVEGQNPDRVASRSSGDAVCRDAERLNFLPLPASAAEARQMLELWSTAGATGRPSGLLGRAATESAFKKSAPGQRYLHLATHGFLRLKTCASPAAQAAAGTENPLLLTGLAMAGANVGQTLAAGEDDGLLTGEEIAALDLSSVEWTVLSACSTGLGETTASEGVLGLRRAFRMAGVGTIISSLWPIDDEATRTFMAELYQARLGRGLDTAAALRAASLALLKARRERGESTHPHGWGAFLAEGDWR